MVTGADLGAGIEHPTHCEKRKIKQKCNCSKDVTSFLEFEDY